MRDAYVGNLGDFAKYSLLRVLTGWPEKSEESEEALPLHMVWFRVFGDVGNDMDPEPFKDRGWSYLDDRHRVRACDLYAIRECPREMHLVCFCHLTSAVPPPPPSGPLLDRRRRRALARPTVGMATRNPTVTHGTQSSTRAAEPEPWLVRVATTAWPRCRGCRGPGSPLALAFSRRESR